MRLTCFDAAVSKLTRADGAGGVAVVDCAIEKAEKKAFTVSRQIDGITLPAIGNGPWQAENRKAAIGSFMLKLDDRTSVRVKRAE